MPAVLFDVDGTLVTFEFDVPGAKKALVEEMTRMGIDTSDVSLTSPIQAIIDAARLKVQRGRDDADFAPLKRRLYAILDDFEVESSSKSTMFPGTKKTLLYLRSRSVRLGVFTNSGRRAAYSLLRNGGILECFDFVLTREDVDTMKPSPAGILKALERFSLPKEEVCYVGDGIFDITAARAAGLKVVSVATGNYTPERLRKEGADFVISSLAELPGILGV
ncbi:MAG TPA: HAD family hydrolase [Nitrososphaerales archaeon]|nr:HAD family hydrolase [Nitrososphaerales archaeon]